MTDFASPGKIVQLGVAPNRVDLLTMIDGVTFEEAWHGRVSGHYGSESVDYIGRAEPHISNSCSRQVCFGTSNLELRTLNAPPLEDAIVGDVRHREDSVEIFAFRA